MYIYDAHAHIFPEKIEAKAVKAIGEFYSIEMEGQGLAEKLIENGKEFGIKKYVVSSTATTVHQVGSINKFILGEMQKHKEFAGLITLHPDMEGSEIEKEIKFGVDNGFHGIKLHPDFQRFNIDDEKAEKIYAAAEGVLPILFHTGDNRYDFSKPFRLANIAKKYKKLNCVGAHFGGYSSWGELDCYEDLDNVFFDTSSSLFCLDNEKAVALIEKFGADKFMYGSDFPMWTESGELERLKKLNLKKGDLKKILYKNAKRIYNIK